MNKLSDYASAVATNELNSHTGRKTDLSVRGQTRTQWNRNRCNEIKLYYQQPVNISHFPDSQQDMYISYTILHMIFIIVTRHLMSGVIWGEAGWIMACTPWP